MKGDVDFDRLLRATHGMAVEYLEGQDQRPVVPTQKALADLRTFEEPMPEGPTDPRAVVAQLHLLGSPGTVVTTGGRYFGFVSSGVLPAALAANWLAGAWDQNAGFWAMSPVGSKLEHVVARQGLPEAPAIRIVTSADIHPSNIRALSYLGIGREEVERVDTDAQGRLIPERLPPVDDRTVLLVQAGNVNSGAFDAFGEVCDRAQESGAWVHVDGAFGLWARASPSMRRLTDGIERADSWNLDGHKWLNLPMDSGVFGCRHPQAVFDAFAVEAPYMVRSERREPSRFTPELGRRARGIEFWAALKSLGRRGVADLVERSCAYARRYAAELEALGFEILNDVCLNQVLFALDSQERTGAVLAMVQESGQVWIGPTEWRGRLAMRISCCAWNMDDTDFDVTMNTIRVAVERSHATARGPEP